VKNQSRFSLLKNISLIIILLSLLLSGCSKIQVEPQELVEVEITTTPKPTVVISSTKKEPSQTPTTNEGVSVDSSLFNVEISFPASWFSDEDMSTFDTDAYVKKNDFKKAIINEDGSITVTMSKSRHKEVLEEYADTITTTFAEMIDSEDYPYITGITPNSDYSLVYVDVDRTGYESAFFDISPLMIATQALFYQTFAGLDYHSEIIIRDNVTNEEIKSIIYPDAFN